MDLEEFDCYDDRTYEFLLNKLEEVRAKNEKMRSELLERRPFYDTCEASGSSDMDETDIKISSEAWKYIFNDKYILGISIQNFGQRPLCNLKALLKWDSSLPLSYQVFLYEESDTSSSIFTRPTFACEKENCSGITNSLKKSNEVKKSAYIVIVLDRPQFVENLSYKITGNVIFQQGDINKGSIEIKFPQVEIFACEALSHYWDHFILTSTVVRQLLIITSGSVETKLKIILPKDRCLENTFENLCSLTKVNTEDGCRKLFMAHEISPEFDTSLLIFHAPKKANGTHVYGLTAYTKNGNRLNALLHHVYKHVPDVLIIPEFTYENAYQFNTGSDRLDAKKLRDCIQEEIAYKTSMLRKFPNVSDKDYDALLKIQKNAEIEYLKVLHSFQELE